LTEPPEYDLVIVVFERALEGAWPEWTTTDAGDLYEGIKRRNLPLFEFPGTRLEAIAPDVSNSVDDNRN
jgi:hypothetical protein